MRDFSEEFKLRLRKINELNKPKTKPLDEKGEKLYNIHKRSLPVGIDDIVVMRVTKAEAEFLLNHRSECSQTPLLTPQSYQHDDKDSKTIIYYDIIPVDATPRERNVYYNKRPFVKE